MHRSDPLSGELYLGAAFPVLAAAAVMRRSGHFAESLKSGCSVLSAGVLSFVLKDQRSPFILTLEQKKHHEPETELETSKTVSPSEAKANSILPVPTVFPLSLLSLSPFSLLLSRGNTCRFYPRAITLRAVSGHYAEVYSRAASVKARFNEKIITASSVVFAVSDESVYRSIRRGG